MLFPFVSKLGDGKLTSNTSVYTSDGLGTFRNALSTQYQARQTYKSQLPSVLLQHTSCHRICHLPEFSRGERRPRGVSLFFFGFFFAGARPSAILSLPTLVDPLVNDLVRFFAFWWPCNTFYAAHDRSMDYGHPRQLVHGRTCFRQFSEEIITMQHFCYGITRDRNSEPSQSDDGRTALLKLGTLDKLGC